MQQVANALHPTEASMPSVCSQCDRSSNNHRSRFTHVNSNTIMSTWMSSPVAKELTVQLVRLVHVTRPLYRRCQTRRGGCTFCTQTSYYNHSLLECYFRYLFCCTSYPQLTHKRLTGASTILYELTLSCRKLASTACSCTYPIETRRASHLSGSSDWNSMYPSSGTGLPQFTETIAPVLRQHREGYGRPLVAADR